MDERTKIAMEAYKMMYASEETQVEEVEQVDEFFGLGQKKPEQKPAQKPKPTGGLINRGLEQRNQMLQQAGASGRYGFERNSYEPEGEMTEDLRQIRHNVTDALPWNRNTEWTTKGERRKPGENVHGQQTGRGLNTSTSVMTKDGTDKTTPNLRRQPPLQSKTVPQRKPLIQQNNSFEPEGEQVDEADSIEKMKERAAKRRKQRYGASDTSQGGRDDFRPYTKADYERGAANDPRKKTNEDVDIFDTILDYLISEGYADTNENALVIMANMSEEWRQSIVESMARGSAPNSPTGNLGGLTGDLIKRGTDIIKKNIPQFGGTSTRPGDGKPYKDGPLWDSNQKPEDVPTSKPKPPVRKPPMRDEPLW